MKATRALIGLVNEKTHVPQPAVFVSSPLSCTGRRHGHGHGHTLRLDRVLAWEGEGM